MGLARADEENPYVLKVPLGLEKPPIPAHNPLTADKVELGRRLFFEKKLSRNGAVSCASCHVPEKSFQNGARFATGVNGRAGLRNVPGLNNRAYGARQFWDGRAATLEEQVDGPLEHPDEMGSTWEAALKTLNGAPAYTALFQRVFSGPATRQNVSMALASYERTLLSGNSPYDRYRAGDKDALSPLAREGEKLFFQKHRCTQCHSGPNFTDEKLSHRCYPAFATLDPKAYPDAVVDPATPVVKTPSLRNVALTAPYLHNGSLSTLDEVLDFYSFSSPEPQRGDVPSYEIGAAEKKALTAFLQSLTGQP